MSSWHPRATRTQLDNAGTYQQPAPNRLVWHTTEGSALPVYRHSAPHFTLDPGNGLVWQHAPIGFAAKPLEHRAGTVHTNHAHAIQVELIGFTDAAFARRIGADPRRIVSNWGDPEYDRIAKLARWIEFHGRVPRSAGVSFASPQRMNAADWLRYSGHCGHVHVPGNSHWDAPGLRIDKILAFVPDPPVPAQRKVKPVRALKRPQVMLRKRNLKRAARSVRLALDELRRRGR